MARTDLVKTFFNPKFRISLFVTLANASWMIVCWMWLERETWLWITPIALSINCLLLTYDQILHFRSLEGQPLLGNDAWGILKTVNELSSELHIPAPKIFLIESPSALLFAYAKTRKHTRLFISEGTLQLLTPRQLRAVITYQMIAIRQSYSILNYWVAAMLDLFFRIGRACERAFAFVFGWTPKLAAWFIAPWMWFLRMTLIGARDFYRLDGETARALDNGEDLAQALWKLDSYAQTRPWPEPWIFAHMCMVSPLKVKAFSLVRVHPTLQTRIKNLVGRYPL